MSTLAIDQDVTLDGAFQIHRDQYGNPECLTYIRGKILTFEHPDGNKSKVRFPKSVGYFPSILLKDSRICIHSDGVGWIQHDRDADAPIVVLGKCKGLPVYF